MTDNTKLIEDFSLVLTKAYQQALIDERERQIAWFNGTCQHRVPFHTRWQCVLCKDIFVQSLKKGGKDG